MAFSKCEKIEVGLHDGHNDARLLSSGQQATSHKIIAKFQCPYIFRERKIKVGNCAVPRNSIQVTAAASTENSCPRISSKAEIVLRADHLTTKTKMRAAARRPVFKFDVAHFAHSPDPHTKIHICMSFSFCGSHGTRALGPAKVSTPQQNDPCVCSAAGRRARSICLLAFVAACFLSHAIILALAKSTLPCVFFSPEERRMQICPPRNKKRVNCLLSSPFS